MEEGSYHWLNAVDLMRGEAGDTVVIASISLLIQGEHKKLPVAGGLARELKVIGSSE